MMREKLVIPQNSFHHRYLDLLHRKGAYSDVVREAQEIVELSLTGMLRSVGVEPPTYHDVGNLLLEHKEWIVELAILIFSQY